MHNKLKKNPRPAAGVSVALLAMLALAQAAPRRLLVTFTEPPAEPPAASGLELRVGKQAAAVRRLVPSEDAPVQLAVLIAETAGPELVQSLPAVRELVRGLPDGSQVLIGYVQTNSVVVVAPFTADREAAADALRVPLGVQTPGDLGQLFHDALAFFPEQSAGRAQLLYIGEGTPPDGGGIYNDYRLNRFIREAQQRGVVLWCIHASGGESPAFAGAAHADGEALLERAARETGGRAFALTRHLPTLDAPLAEFRALLDRQYVLEFDPPAQAASRKTPEKLELRVGGRRGQLLHAAR
jgi:hypothetical protein